jgi:propanediol dehydratase large subunit
VSERSFGVLLDRLNASGSSGSSAGSSGGTVTGNHGDQLLSVQVSPQASTLSTSSATTVKTSADLKFIATVQDSGDFPEYNVVVTLSLDVGGTPITKKQTILVVQPGANATATFSDFQLPTSAYAKQVNMTVTVRKVPGEHVLTNNTATYPVFFTLSP